jgi:hypothetical protein
MDVKTAYEIPVIWIETLFFPGVFRRHAGTGKRSRLPVLSVLLASIIAAVIDTVWYYAVSIQTRLEVLMSFMLYMGKNLLILVSVWLVISLFLNMFAKMAGGRGKLRDLMYAIAFVCSGMKIALSVLFLLTAFTGREGAVLFINLLFLSWFTFVTTEAVEVRYKMRRFPALLVTLASVALIWFSYFVLFDITYLTPWLPYF